METKSRKAALNRQIKREYGITGEPMKAASKYIIECWEHINDSPVDYRIKKMDGYWLWNRNIRSCTTWWIKDNILYVQISASKSGKWGYGAYVTSLNLM